MMHSKNKTHRTCATREARGDGDGACCDRREHRVLLRLPRRVLRRVRDGRRWLSDRRSRSRSSCSRSGGRWRLRRLDRDALQQLTRILRSVEPQRLLHELCCIRPVPQTHVRVRFVQALKRTVLVHIRAPLVGVRSLRRRRTSKWHRLQSDFHIL